MNSILNDTEDIEDIESAIAVVQFELQRSDSTFRGFHEIILDLLVKLKKVIQERDKLKAGV